MTTAKTSDFSGTLYYNPSGPGFNAVAQATIQGPTSFNEGATTTFRLVTWGIPDGTPIFWAFSASEIDQGRITSSNTNTVVNHRATCDITVSADNATASGTQLVNIFVVNANTYSNVATLSGIVVNDTSQTRVQLTSGTSLAFNGTNNQNVRVTGTLSDWAMGDNWCIEWWEKMPDAGLGDFRGVIAQMVNSDPAGIDVWHNGGNIYINNAQIAFAQPTPGEWHHIAVQKYGGIVKAYIDGVSQILITNTAGASTFTNTSNALIIGNRTFDGTNAIGQTFKGELANIRISSGLPEPRYSVTFIAPTTVTVDGFTRLALSGQVGGNGMLDDVSNSNHTIGNYGAVVIPSISLVGEFMFQNAGSNYSIDGIGFPTLTLIRGGTYTFDLSQITASYPWALRLSNGDTSVVPGTTGGQGNGGSGNNTINGVFGTSPAGTVPSTIVYQVPLDAPSSIVYQCVYVSPMIGTINIEY